MSESVKTVPIAMRTSAVPEWQVLLILAGAQFAHILDFVIMIPLGPQFMRVFALTPQQFGFLVSSYTFSGAVCGFIGAFVIERFDRKNALIGLTIGFALGTFACAAAPTYPILLAARALAGAFGGLMGAVVFSIVGDTFAESRRGAATGTVMSAFSLASVVGVPFGLWAAHFTWRIPFFALAVISLVLVAFALRVLPPLQGHLSAPRARVIDEVRFMLLTRNHWTAYGLIVAMMFAVFTVIPFLATYLVKNVGLTESQLPWVYFSGGLFTLVTSRLVGRLADRFGKPRVFTLLATGSIAALLLLTNLPRVSVAAAVLATTLFTVVISGRAVPAMSMITSSVESSRRGSFMSFTTAIQQFASAIASLLGGWILGEAATGELLHYERVGYVAVAATIVSIVLANRLKTVT